MIDEFMRRGGNALFSRQSSHGAVPVFELARLSVDDIPLQRSGPVRGQCVDKCHRVGNHRVRHCYIARTGNRKHLVHTLLSKRRVSGIARVTPIAARVTAPTPPTDVTGPKSSRNPGTFPTAAWDIVWCTETFRGGLRARLQDHKTSNRRSDIPPSAIAFLTPV
jgi:hypothetical protein